MNCCVIGIGNFGYYLSLALIENKINVIAVDSDIVAIERIQNKVNHVICLKINDEESLKMIDVENMDVVVIAIGNNFEDSVMIAALLKRKFNVPMIVCRSMNNQHKEILDLIGIDLIVIPEQEAGIRLADKLNMDHRNFNRVTSDFSFTYIRAHKKWIGRLVQDISEFNNEKIYILGIRAGELIKKIKSDHIILISDLILIAGNNDDLEKFLNE